LFARLLLHALVSRAVRVLVQEPENSAAWQPLHAVLGGLPLYPEIVAQLQTAIPQMDFVRLCAQHPETGWLAMHTAALQVSHLSAPDLSNFLKDQLVGIARLLAERHTDAPGSHTEGVGIFQEPKQACCWLLEWALYLCRTTTSGQESSEEFVALLTRLLETWPFMIAVCQPLVQDFVEALPVILAQPFAALLVHLRAARVD
jgi:hypothetical protein